MKKMFIVAFLCSTFALVSAQSDDTFDGTETTGIRSNHADESTTTTAHEAHTVTTTTTTTTTTKTTVEDELPVVAVDQKQEKIKKVSNFNTHPFQHLGIGIKASTMGYGLELSTNISKNFILRAGVNYFDYSYSTSVSIDDENVRNVIEGGYDPDYKFDAKLQFFNGHALLDIHPMRYGIFHFTVGAFFGNNKIDASGLLVNPETGEPAQLRSVGGIPLEWPTINFDGREIVIGEGGRIDATLKLGDVVKPYVGIGIGRSLPKSRLAFMFELGAIYQGDFVVEQGGNQVNLNNASGTIAESFSNINDYSKYFKWWPMLNFQLSYRIF